MMDINQSKIWKNVNGIKDDELRKSVRHAVLLIIARNATLKNAVDWEYKRHHYSPKYNITEGVRDVMPNEFFQQRSKLHYRKNMERRGCENVHSKIKIEASEKQNRAHMRDICAP